MKKLALAATILALSAAPSFASFGLMCEGPEDVAVSLPLGGGVGLTVLGAEIRTPNGTWTTEEGVAGTTEIAGAQGAAVDSRFYFDFADSNFEAIIVEIRLFQAHEETMEPVYGGTLRIAGHGVWPLTCSMG